jgi:tetratricopeptide (TPR) repeat protein
MIFTPAKTGARLVLIGFCATGLLASRVGYGAPTQPVVPPILLVEPRDQTPLDAQIRSAQKRLQRSALPAAELERLGWLWVAKARASSDPGYYTLAGMAADALEKTHGATQQAWLLRGHVLQTRHRFAQAEALGRRLVLERGAAADYALWGDALYDQGRIAEAADAYQHMVDLKPGLDSYSRAANIRWIKGDLAGAIELQAQAVAAGGPGDPGALAWSLVRLAQFVWQQGDALAAETLTTRAIELLPEFQPALLLQGRLLLASGHPVEALAPLARAAEILPLPEPRWVYAEALRAAGRDAAAIEMETRLVREGTAEDPRTVALFLATRGADPATAVRLAAAELKNRADVITHSTSALALGNAARLDEARMESRAALAEGTADARLWLHAARIAALAHRADAADLLVRARRLAPLLLPSERRLLEDSFALLPGSGLTGNPHKTTPQKTS